MAKKRKKTIKISRKVVLILSIVSLFFVILIIGLWSIRGMTVGGVKIREDLNKEIVYWTYSAPDGFSVKYPSNWERLEQGLAPGFLLAVVDNGTGAQIGIIRDALPKNKSLGQMLEERVNNFRGLGEVNILESSAKDKEATIEFVTKIASRPLHSTARAVLAREAGKYYVVLASAPAKEYGDYEKIIEQVVGSIQGYKN